MRRMTPARLPETLAFLMRRRAISRLGTLGALALSHSLQARTDMIRPSRIVCIGGALTEIIYALGAESCLVGVDTSSTFPSQALSLPQVGYARNLSAEGILALAPTQVLVTEDAGPATVLRQVTAAGVPVELLDSAHSFEGLLQRITLLGRMLACETQSFTLIDQLNNDWKQIQSLPVSSDAVLPRVLFLFAHSANRLMAAGAQTGAHAMIEYAGAINAATQFTGYKPISPESLVQSCPDILLFTEHGLHALGDLSTVMKLQGVSQTRAGKDQRIAVMDVSLLLGFGPRMPEAVRRLRAQFHLVPVASSAT